MLSGIVAKTVDFMFRAYYSRALGGEGMGILSLCFAAHGIMLNISSGGIGVAVSKLASERLSRGEFFAARRTTGLAIGHVCLLGMAVVAAAAGASGLIAEVFLKEPRGAMSIAYLSPSILFMGISYCIKGYFYAARRVFPPASSEFVEQLVKISVITFLLSKWQPLGVEKGCAAVCLGLSIGELSSCLYLMAFYLAEGIRKGRRKLYDKGIYAGIIKIAVPVTLTSMTMSFLRLREDVLVISALKKSGLEHKNALEIYGSIKGMIMPLIVFPLNLLSSFFTMLVPEISRACSMKSTVRLKTLVSRIYRFSAMLGFAVMCVFLVFSKSLADVVYSAPEISGWLKIISVFIPFMFMDSVSSGMLNGMGKQSSLLVHGLLDSATRLLLVAALVPGYGINAFIAVIAVSNIFTCTLTVKKVLKTAKVHFQASDWVIKHLFCSVVTVFTAQSFFCGVCEKSLFLLGSGIFATAVLYILWTGALGKNMRSDMRWLLGRTFMP